MFDPAITTSDRVKQAIQSVLKLTPGQVIQDTDNVKDDLGADSLDLIEIVMEIEDQYGMDIPDEEVDGNFDTVASITAFIDKKLGAEG